MDLRKADGVFILLWENFNSLQIRTDSTVLGKMRCLDAHRKIYKANILAERKAHTNWYKVPDGQHFDEIVGLEEHTRCKSAHNIHDHTRCQPGGTMIATFGRTMSYDIEMDKDKTGLGRWVWTVFDTGTTRQRLVLAYFPSAPSTLKTRGINVKSRTKVYQ